MGSSWLRALWTRRCACGRSVVGRCCAPWKAIRIGSRAWRGRRMGSSWPRALGTGRCACGRSVVGGCCARWKAIRIGSRAWRGRRMEGLLIFPTLFPTGATRDGTQLGHAVSLYYDFSGAIDKIYSSLVVRLALSERFGRVRLWEDGAEFEQPGQGVCALHKLGGRRGTAHLDILFTQN